MKLVNALMHGLSSPPLFPVFAASADIERALSKLNLVILYDTLDFNRTTLVFTTKCYCMVSTRD